MARKPTSEAPGLPELRRMMDALTPGKRAPEPGPEPRPQEGRHSAYAELLVSFLPEIAGLVRRVLDKGGATEETDVAIRTAKRRRLGLAGSAFVASVVVAGVTGVLLWRRASKNRGTTLIPGGPFRSKLREI